MSRSVEDRVFDANVPK